MDYKAELIQLFEKGHEIYVPNISLDCVIFGFHENQLKILLIKPKFTADWSLLGGYIKKQENAEAAAKRILQERAGIENEFQKQFEVFSDPNRCTKKIINETIINLKINLKKSWLYDRVITIGFTALLDFTKTKIRPDIFCEDCKWFNINEVPKLIFDHNAIVEKALADLRNQINYLPIGKNLLPTKFSMPELQKLYETLLDRKLDRRNFQRKIISNGILKKLNETKKTIGHKAPILYKFVTKQYKNALRIGMGFDL
jgi:8-oxo-dGTP diphosphatase